MIKFKNVKKAYKTGEGDVEALKGITFEVTEGDFVAVQGSSGSGKTTLLNIIGLLDRPTSGSYFLGGAKVSDMEERELALVRNKKIGFVFQSFNLLPRYSALENVLLPFLYSAEPPSEPEKKAKDALNRVGLADRIHHLPSQLSGGQQQRVAIARALINEPAIILADEPTGALDSKSGYEIMGILQELNEKDNKTVLIITHENDIALHCQHIVTLQDGSVSSYSFNSQRLRAVESLASLEVVKK